MLDLISTKEAARIAGCSAETIIRWCLHDGLTAYRRRCGKVWRYRVCRRSLLERLSLVQTGAAPEPSGIRPETLERLRRLGVKV